VGGGWRALAKAHMEAVDAPVKVEKASCNARQIAEAQRLAREWKPTEWHCHGARSLRRSCWPGGYLTYIITTRRITSGELLKYRNGLLNGRQTATAIPGVDDVRSRVRAACKWPPRAKTAALRNSLSGTAPIHPERPSPVRSARTIARVASSTLRNGGVSRSLPRTSGRPGRQLKTPPHP
jgi:hypothetical protein